MLTLDQLRQKVPAAFAEKPASHVSNNYKFIPTYKVLEELGKKGWIVIFAKQQKSKRSESLDTTKHKILLRNKDISIANPTLGSTLPTIELVNSHDWSSVFQLSYGMLRLVCGNGMTYYGPQFNQYAVDHGSIIQNIEQMLSEFDIQAKLIDETNKRWAEIDMDPSDRRELAYEAAKIRFGDSANSDHAISLEIIRRPEDNHNTLYGSWNIIQENMMKGGNKVGKRRTKAISNIHREQEINRALFVAASKFDPTME